MVPRVDPLTIESEELGRMERRRGRVDSLRVRRLAEQMLDERYRDAYVASHTRQMLARQMRKFRGEMSQAEFANILGKRQTIVARLENSSYIGWTLRTLFEVAKAVKVAVFVRFVDFPTFLKYTDDMSDGAMRPKEYDQQDIDQFSRWIDFTEARESKPQPGSGAITLQEWGTGVNEAIKPNSGLYNIDSHPN
jgi:hypothetical protein